MGSKIFCVFLIQTQPPSARGSGCGYEKSRIRRLFARRRKTNLKIEHVRNCACVPYHGQVNFA
jgi:hypothetical protein